MLALVGVLALAIVLSGRKRSPVPVKPRPKPSDVQQTIRRVAASLGVEPAIALAFAELESGFDAHASGDLQWAEKRPAKYRELVLDAAKFAHNPARGDPSAWHSYGLFGLLAPYHVRPNEHPHVLWDPEINAERGIQTIKRLLHRTNHDLAATRLSYVGCGSQGQRCADEYATKVLERFAEVYGRWRHLEGIA